MIDIQASVLPQALVEENVARSNAPKLRICVLILKTHNPCERLQDGETRIRCRFSSFALVNECEEPEALNGGVFSLP